MSYSSQQLSNRSRPRRPDPNAQNLTSNSSAQDRHENNQHQQQLESRTRALVNGIRDTALLCDKAIDTCIMTGIDLEDMNEDSKLKQIDNAIKRLIDAKTRLRIEKEALTNAELISSRSDEDFEAIHKRLASDRIDQYNALSEKKRFARDPKYRDFREQIWELKHEGEPMPRLFDGDEYDDDGGDEEEEEDLMVSGARLTYKCPITTSWLVDPVTSSVCKHSYSKEAILDYLRASHGSCKCPVAGCSKVVQISNLKSDRLLEKKLARHLRQLEAENSSTSYTIVR